MDRIELIRLLDQEIERLRQARTLLAGTTDQNSSHGRRKMSAKARRRISEAQKKRWAARKKAAK